MKILFIIPGDINLPTGGYRYDRKILEQWSSIGLDTQLVSLEGNFPNLETTQIANFTQRADDLPLADVAVIDGLAGGVLPDFVKALSERMPVVALVHHPLFLENGLSQNQVEKLKASEAAGLGWASAIVTTSHETAKTVSSFFGFPPNKIHSVLPGVVRGKISKGSETETVNLLCVASIIERKGHRFLLDALKGLRELNWHLDCIGMTSSDPELYSDLMQSVDSSDMGDQISFHGSVTEIQIENAYERADIFVLPSLYEGYGMAYAEAIVRGIPVIGTTAGAIPDTVPKSCGILVAPQNTSALETALRQMITDNELRHQYRKAALDAEPTFPTWSQSAEAFANILESVR